MTPAERLRPGKIVAVGLNYLDHVLETGMTVPERPLLFAKFPSSVIANGEPIVIDRSITGHVNGAPSPTPLTSAHALSRGPR